MALGACSTTPEAGRPTDADIRSDAPLTDLALSLVAGDNPVSGTVWSRATHGHGPVELNRSNGGLAEGDGGPLTLNGKTSPRGAGVHARSELSFSVGGRCAAFAADLGIDDEAGTRGSVVFQVFGDGVKLSDSGTMTGASATRSVRVDVAGRSTLTLVVTDGGEGRTSDHADWAAPTLLSCQGPATPGAGVPAGALTPEQFGARGDGVTNDTAALGSLFSALNARPRAVSFGAGTVYRDRRTGPV